MQATAQRSVNNLGKIIVLQEGSGLFSTLILSANNGEVLHEESLPDVCNYYSSEHCVIRGLIGGWVLLGRTASQVREKDDNWDQEIVAYWSLAKILQGNSSEIHDAGAIIGMGNGIPFPQYYDVSTNTLFVLNSDKSVVSKLNSNSGLISDSFDLIYQFPLVKGASLIGVSCGVIQTNFQGVNGYTDEFSLKKTTAKTC